MTRWHLADLWVSDLQKKLAWNSNVSFLKRNIRKTLPLYLLQVRGMVKNRGLNHLAHTGLIKRIIGGHWGLVPKLQEAGHVRTS